MMATDADASLRGAGGKYRAEEAQNKVVAGHKAAQRVCCSLEDGDVAVGTVSGWFLWLRRW